MGTANKQKRGCSVRPFTMETADRFGMSERRFGAWDDDFYGAVGRIALLAGLLEDRLDVLYALLDRRDSSSEGKPASQKVEACRKAARRLNESSRLAANDFLDEVSHALGLRNEVVHSLWPASDSANQRGHRITPKGERKWTRVTVDDFPDLIRRLDGLRDACEQIEVLAQSQSS